MSALSLLLLLLLLILFPCYYYYYHCYYIYIDYHYLCFTFLYWIFFSISHFGVQSWQSLNSFSHGLIHALLSTKYRHVVSNTSNLKEAIAHNIVSSNKIFYVYTDCTCWACLSSLFITFCFVLNQQMDPLKRIL